MSSVSTLPSPTSYLDFCARSPGECGVKAQGDVATADVASRQTGLYQRYWGEVFQTSTTLQEPDGGANADAGARLVLTTTIWNELSDTNRRVNATVHYETDQAFYGRADLWTLPAKRGGAEFGDCKDIALEKRHDLIAAGIPASALALAIVRTPGGGTHAVLIASTDRGDYVLDSLSPWVSPWQGLSYAWVERQDPQNPTHWFSLDRGPQETPTLQSASIDIMPRPGS